MRTGGLPDRAAALLLQFFRKMGVTRRRMRPCVLIVLSLACGACANMPRAMSSYSEFQQASQERNIDLVPLTAASLPAPAPGLTELPPEFTGAVDFPYDRIGEGDRLHVRIWESGAATVFSGTGNSDLGELTVDESGKLYLPYAGSIQAAGMTIPELRAAIIARLRTVVLRPQVDIREVEPRSRLVTVQGAASKTGVYPIERGRTRLGELLAEVAPKGEAPEMLTVSVRRAGQAVTLRLSDVYRNPALDIALRPGDSIVLDEQVENVTVLGAAGVQGQVRISKPDFTLIDALGQARGLNPEAADPRAVFVLRLPEGSGARPLVYQLDMRRPESFALAGRFVLQPDDAVLISSAPWAQTRQVLSAFAQSIATVRSVATLPVP